MADAPAETTKQKLCFENAQEKIPKIGVFFLIKWFIFFSHSGFFSEKHGKGSAFPLSLVFTSDASTSAITRKEKILILVLVLADLPFLRDPATCAFAWVEAGFTEI